MKTRFILSFVALAVIVSAYGQKPTISLTFTAAYYQGTWVKLDSIIVSNNSQSVDTVLYYPDTVLVLEYAVGIPGNNKHDEAFRVIRNCPNPVLDQTMIIIFVPEKDNVDINVTDIRGMSLLRADWQLDRGYHSFYFTPGEAGLLFLTATWKGIKSTIKIISESAANPENAVTYAGFEGTGLTLKSHEKTLGFAFNLGDSLLYIGYAQTTAGIQGSDVIEDAPQSNETYLFEIVEGIPCPGMPTINYGWQTYTTVQIGNQCWMKENLNIGTMINGTQEQTNNNIIEKYCYNDIGSNCNIYGGLYQWNEMMQYTTTPGVRGICPPDWHLPTYNEWNTLSTFLGGNGTAGGKMKETGLAHWASPNTGATNESGFTVLPAGYRNLNGYFLELTISGSFWASTQYSATEAWCRYIYYNYKNLYNDPYIGTNAWSVRCLKD